MSPRRARAEAAGELREVVGGVKPVDRLAPPVAVDEIVPVGDQVAEGTALMTEGDAAVHAARPLLLELLALERQVDLLPVVNALGHGPPRRGLTLDLEETGDLAHAQPSRGPRPSRRRPPTCRSPPPS